MRFGQYELLGRIAVGGMAEIYHGRAIGEEGFEKPVAIKRILPHFAQDARFVAMLLTEARIHAQLSHRNIVQIHDLGISEEGEYFIVLEYVDGRDLGAVLETLARASTPGGRALRLSDAVALHVIIELGEGVHFAHELRGADGQPLGLVHRDISPSNVLLSYAGEVKLLDFGLAKRRTDVSVVGSLKGKLAYMSPEQARRAPLDRRSDVFALGAVLFEMLTGRRLREIANEVEGWKQVASGLVPSPRPLRPDLTAPLERLLARALAADPRDRFPDARALVAAAREALESVPRTARGEAAELQAMLQAVLPPGSPRPVSAPSKVIRLVSEILPSDQTLRAAAPVSGPSNGRPARPAAPGLTPAMPMPPVAPPPLAAPPAAPPVPPAGAVPMAAPGPRPRRRAWRLALGFLLGAAGVGAFVHFALIPLPLVLTWSRPARLEIRSEPPGATVLLDGDRLSAPTPTYVEVRRDRRTHVIEIRKEGFQVHRRPVRFDRDRALSVSVTLAPENRPSFQPIPPARK